MFAESPINSKPYLWAKGNAPLGWDSSLDSQTLAEKSFDSAVLLGGPAFGDQLLMSRYLRVRANLLESVAASCRIEKSHFEEYR